MLFKGPVLTVALAVAARSSSPVVVEAPWTALARDVVGGELADVVNFSLEPDITRLVRKYQVNSDWSAGALKGIPFDSIVTLVVRKGDPKNVHHWSDLLQPVNGQLEVPGGGQGKVPTPCGDSQFG